MNVRRGWFAVLGAILIGAPTYAKDPIASENPGPAMMALEELISCSNCCPWVQGSLAKTAGSHAGKWLVAVTHPTAPNAASPNATAATLPKRVGHAKRSEAPQWTANRVLPSPPTKRSHSPQRQIVAHLEILRANQQGEWKTICRPTIATISGRPATMEFMQHPGQLMRVKLDMQAVKPADAAAPAQLLAEMLIEEVDKDGKATTLAKPHIIALQDQDAEIMMARKDGILKVKLRMAELPIEKATGKVYPNPVAAPPQPQVVDSAVAPRLPRTVLPRPLPPAPRAWAPYPKTAQSKTPAPYQGRLIFAQVKIEEQNDNGQWTTVTRPQVVAVEGQDATIEVGEHDGERLCLAINMTCIPLAAPAKDAVQQLFAKMRLTRVNAAGKRVVFAEPQIVALENETCRMALRSADGRAIKVELTMCEMSEKQVAKKLWNKNPNNIPDHVGDSTAPQTVSSLQQPAGLATGVQAPMELVASQADPRSKHLARTPATRPATQPATRSLTSWITTAPTVTAAAPLAPLPPAVVPTRPAVTATISSDESTESYFAQKTKYEEHYQNKLTQLLAHVPNAKIAVDVQLAAGAKPEQVRVAVTFPDNYIEQLWESQRISDAPVKSEELLALLDEVKASIGELAAAVLPAGVNGETSVVIQAYTEVAPHRSLAQTAAAPRIVYAPPTSSAAFDFAPWMLGVIAITLLCASIGAAVLFRRAPTPATPEAVSESLPRPPRRRAA